MQKMTILFGFDSSQFSSFITAVTQYLRKNGIEVNPVCKLSKQAIRDYIQNNPSVYTVVLTETLKKGKFTAEELAELTDDRDMNIIVVLGSNHKGTDYMQTLYAAGITSALFQDGKKGLSASDTCKYIYRKRSRREAREYYGISDRKMELGFLSNGTFAEHYAALSDEQYGETLIERFLMVCQRMSAKQIKDFVRRLDDDTKNELVQYEEFYVVVDMLKQFKVDLGIKRPRRKLKVGLANATQLIGLKSTLQRKPAAGTEQPGGPIHVQQSSVTPVEMNFTQVKADRSVSGDEFLGDLFGGFGDSEPAADTSDTTKSISPGPSESSYEPEIEVIDLSSLFADKDVDETILDPDRHTEQGNDIDTASDENEEQDQEMPLSAKERRAELKRLKKEEKERKKLEKLKAKEEKIQAKNSQKLQITSKKHEIKKKTDKNSKSKSGVDKTLVAMGVFAGFVFLCLVFAVLVLVGVIPMM